MISIPSYTDPPQWMQSVISSLLPPAYREPVLGDLQERFNERGGGTRWLGYVGDVVTTVPQVLRSQMRRIAARGVACGASVPGELRTRAELLQIQVWIRNAAMLFSVVVVVGAFLLNAQGVWQFNDSVSLMMTIGWVGAVWQSYIVTGQSKAVPPSLPWDKLRSFHRDELMRQMNVGCRRYVYWSIPAALLILYALIAAVPGFRGGAMLLGALTMQNGLIALVYRNERRRYQNELVLLDQDVERV